MPFDSLTALSLSKGCHCRRHTMVRFDKPFGRLTALRGIEGLTTPRTVRLGRARPSTLLETVSLSNRRGPSRVEGAAAHDEIREPDTMGVT